MASLELEAFELDNISVDKKLLENIYDISYKTLINSKPLQLKFDKIDRFIKVYDGARHLTLFGSEATYNRIKCLIS